MKMLTKRGRMKFYIVAHRTVTLRLQIRVHFEAAAEQVGKWCSLATLENFLWGCDSPVKVSPCKQSA